MEMIIVCGIIGVILVVIFASYRNYDSQVLLRNLAYEIALSVRDAQIRSISTTGTGTGTERFLRAYGINFSDSATASANQSYSLFFDTDDSKTFQANEEVSTYTIGRGVYVSDICLSFSSGADDCTQTSVAITYERPHLEAVYRTALSDTTDNLITKATITITSPKGTTRQIEFDKTGRVSVGAGS